MCAVLATFGLLVASEPQILGFPGNGNRDTTNRESVAARVLWPLCCALGYVPAAIKIVLMERESKRPDVCIMYLDISQGTSQTGDDWFKYKNHL